MSQCCCRLAPNSSQLLFLHSGWNSYTLYKYVVYYVIRVGFISKVRLHHPNLLLSLPQVHQHSPVAFLQSRKLMTWSDLNGASTARPNLSSSCWLKSRPTTRPAPSTETPWNSPRGTPGCQFQPTCSWIPAASSSSFCASGEEAVAIAVRLSVFFLLSVNACHR